MNWGIIHAHCKFCTFHKLCSNLSHCLTNILSIKWMFTKHPMDYTVCLRYNSKYHNRFWFIPSTCLHDWLPFRCPMLGKVVTINRKKSFITLKNFISSINNVLHIFLELFYLIHLFFNARKVLATKPRGHLLLSNSSFFIQPAQFFNWYL